MNNALKDAVAQWQQWDKDEASRAEVARLAESDPSELSRMMHPRIAFGTAGLRAEMGPGFARMNSVTVTQASQGLALYVSETVKDAKTRGIVIGHDHRHHSREFAADTVRTFAKAGYKVHFLGQVHTPLVPFGISHLGAACGVMVTASHNPAKDNGYKVYWENACQIIPPHDAGIAAKIETNLDLWDTLSINGSPPVVDLLRAYLETVIDPLTTHKPTEPFTVVYTPMHGVGLHAAEACFKRLGIASSAIVVREQAEPDPDFPTVKFPNPEEKGALELAMKYGDEHDAAIVLATDPDADRFSCAVKHEGKWLQLSGDAIGALFTNFVLSKQYDRPVALVNSTVSSRQMAHQASLAHARYAETLTGFKWIGNKAIDLEAEGYVVPFAYEEAIGYMLGGHAIKDKDGISALYVFVQLLAASRERGSTLLEDLEQIGKRTGFFATHNSYYVVSSPSVTQATFDEIRQQPRDKIGELKVVGWRDLTTGYDSTTPDHRPLLPVSRSSEMITVDLELPDDEKARFTARGSGTEPKLKVYIEAHASSQEKAQVAADNVWDVLSRVWFAKIA